MIRSSILIFISLTTQLNALTTSVIIPCHHKHARFLHTLLKHYQYQTVLPDEVIISISESDKVDPSILTSLNETLWTFPVTLLTTKEVRFAGENRNSCCEKAIGDVFILQDADDIPHPQRVEILKFVFEEHKPDMIMHQYTRQDEEQKKILFRPYNDFGLIRTKKPQTFADTENGGFTNGNVAIARNVFDRIKWTNRPQGQDYQFNYKVHEEFTLLLVKAPLIAYRHFFSSHKKG